MLPKIAETRVNVYKQAINSWGELAQVDMCIEECAELIHAISKLKRGSKTGEQKCIEEIADTYLMLEQLRLIINKDSEIEVIFNSKLNRLKQRLELGKNLKL